MKVIHVTNDLAEASGVGTFVRRINDELNKLGVESSIVTEFEDLETMRRGMESAPYQLVVHVHGMWLGLHHAAAKWAKAHGAKLVWSTHGMTAPWAMHHKWWKKLPAWWLFQKRDLVSADLVHSTSEQEVKWNERMGVRRQCVVPLGTDLPLHPSTSTSTSTKNLLFVGRVYPVKAIDRLIKAFAIACRGGTLGDRPLPMWRMRIVGPDEGGHLDTLVELCKKLHVRCSNNCARRSCVDGSHRETGVDTQVERNSACDEVACVIDFIGPKYGAELEAEYRNCDALALVSHTENFGATVVDAMAHGKPVITSTKTPWSVVEGSWSEELEKGRVKSNDSRCGWWVENEPEVLAKAIEELMAMSDEERAAMGANGRKLVEERFTWKAAGRMMKEAYEGI